MLKKIIIIIGALGVAIGLTLTNQAPEAVYKLFPGYFPDSDKAWEDSPLTPAKITESRLPASVVQDRIQSQIDGGATDKQILFGDTHVHTTNSADAFMYSLPMMHGASGAYPPAFACDYARYISQLDFYFLTDHAESFT